MGNIDWLPIDDAPIGEHILVGGNGWWREVTMYNPQDSATWPNQPTHWAEINPPGDVEKGIPVYRIKSGQFGYGAHGDAAGDVLGKDGE